MPNTGPHDDEPSPVLFETPWIESGFELLHCVFQVFCMHDSGI